MTPYLANNRTNAGLMLGQCRKRLVNINLTLDKYLLFSGYGGLPVYCYHTCIPVVIGLHRNHTTSRVQKIIYHSWLIQFTLRPATFRV